MQREIKFRAWDIEGKEMFTVFMISFVKNGILVWSRSCSDIILMQDTELKDKNGKSIYEGDIVVVPYITPFGKLTTDEHYKVSIGFENGQFVTLNKPESRPLNNWCNREQGEYISNYGHRTIIDKTTVLEVIGNIHEHPHLLKQGE